MAVSAAERVCRMAAANSQEGVLPPSPLGADYRVTWISTCLLACDSPFVSPVFFPLGDETVLAAPFALITREAVLPGRALTLAAASRRQAVSMRVGVPTTKVPEKSQGRPMATGSNAFSSMTSYSSDVSEHHFCAQSSHGAYSSFGGMSGDSPRAQADASGKRAGSHRHGSRFKSPPSGSQHGSQRAAAGMSSSSSYRRGRRPGAAAIDSEDGLHDSRPRTEANQRWPGYPLMELKGKGYNAVQLRTVGHNAADLKMAGYLPEELKAAGFSAHELRAARFRAVELKAVGFGATDLREAKFRAVDLKNAGFSVLELKEVDHTAAEMKSAGYSALELKAARYKASELRDAGYTLLQLKEARFKAADLRDAGYPASEPITVGYSFADLKAGGYPAAELLRAAGYSASELTTLRYTINELIEGGYRSKELRPLGYHLDELISIGYRPTQEDISEELDHIKVHAGLSLAVEEVPGFLRKTRLVTVKLQLSVFRKPESKFMPYAA